MSKSSGNVVAPDEVMNTRGADILRLWVATTDTSDDLRIGPEILKQLEDVYRRFRNTLRYLLGAIDGFTAVEQVDLKEMPILEKWVLHRLAELDQKMRTSAKAYDILEFYNELHTFCAVDLSAFYLDIRKDCLYCDSTDSIKRRATRTVMDHTFQCLTLWLAPVLCFTAEEAYQTYARRQRESIHLMHFPEVPLAWQQPQVAETIERLRDVRRVITGALEIERAAKTIGSSLQASVTVYVTKELADFLKIYDLAEFGITSSAQIVVAQPSAGAFMLEDVHNVGVVVNLATGEKCGRCWKVLPEVENSLCQRCAQVIA